MLVPGLPSLPPTTLEEGGQLESVLGESDSTNREPDRLSIERAVENELATLRAEVGERKAVEGTTE